MKESIGNSMIFSIIIIFVGILLFILVGSISYSKTNKVKNKIADIVEKEAEKAEGGRLSESNFAEGSELATEINSALATIGYRMNGNYNNDCPIDDGTLLNGVSSYKYCVYLKESERGPYYKIMADMYFDFPVIGEMIEIPIFTETKIIYALNGK